MTSEAYPAGEEPPSLAPCLAFDDFRLLATISAECATIRPLHETLEAIAEQLARIAGVERTTITLLDENQEYLEIVAEYPARGEHSFVGQRIRLGGRPVQRGIVEHKAVINALSLHDHPVLRESPEFARAASILGIESLLIVPIEHDGKVIGSIGFDSCKSRTFTEDEIQASLAFANVTSLAIQNARLFEQSRTCHLKVQELTRAPDGQRATHTVNEVAQQVFDSIGRLTEFRKASLQWIDGNRRVLLGARGFDPNRIDPDLQLPLHADGLVEELVRGQVPITISDTGTRTDWIARPGTEDVKSWIGLPILHDNRTIAIVTLDHDQPGYYSKYDADRIERTRAVAQKAADNLQRAHLWDAAQRQIEALKTVNKVGQLVSTKQKVTQVLDVIALAIGQRLNLGQCRLFIAETRDDHVSLVCLAANPELRGESEIVTVPMTEQPDVNPLVWVYRRRVSLLIDDICSDSRFAAVPDSSPPFRSMIAVPLLAGGKAIGVVAVTAEAPSRFSNVDETLVETLAVDAGTAIERAKGLELLHDIGNKVIRAREVETVLREIVRGAMDLTHRESGIIFVLDVEEDRVLEEYTPDRGNHPRPRLRDPNGVTRRVIDSKRELVIADIRHDESVNPVLHDHFRSMIAVPLLMENAVVGVLYLNGREPGGVTAVQMSLLLTLASQGAVAIEKARLYQQIENSEANYRSLVDNIPQFLFRKDIDGRFEFANRRFCETQGLTLDELVGKTDADLYERKLAEKFRSDDRKVIRTQETLAWEEENRPRESKESMWVKVVKTPVLNAQGNVTGVQAIFWDITEEKRIDRRYRSLVDQSPDGIVVFRDRVILLANPAAVKLFGASSEADVVGKPILEFIDESDRELAETRLRAFDNDEDVPESIEMKLRPKEKHGAPVYVEVYSRPTAFRNERQVVFHDLTIVREMHHRVRRTLNQIASLLVQQQAYNQSPEIAKVFGEIHDRIQAMALIHKFLTKVEAAPSVDMDAYFDQLIQKIAEAHGNDTEKVRLVVTKRGVQLNERLATRCGLIVNELATNSILHAFDEDGGTIEISLHETGQDEYELVVSDDGRGMMDDEERTGSMGLTLVQTLVENGLKGSYTIAKQPGTRFVAQFSRPRE